jgi:NAD(P)-dependent dehydrogenase (short-subunit alcohol dehydrogenase family)
MKSDKETLQAQPGREHKMDPQPEYIRDGYQGSEKLKDKVAIITGGDSGIGRAVAVHFAREGAHVVIAYLNEDKDAAETQILVEAEGRLCFTLAGDVGDPAFCRKVVETAYKKLGRIDILVNNSAEQHVVEDITEIENKQIEKTFRTNIFSMFYLTREAVKHMDKGSTIINSTSVTAYRGSKHLIDYSSTKGAILAFTRSLSANLVEKGIRVNAVAPGPIWTPLIVSTFPASKVKEFGKDQPMKRPGQPSEVAPCFVFLASEDSSYMTGQVLHPNGGEIVGG